MKRVTRALLGRMPLPVIGAESDKNARGQALVIAGSASVPGAVLLAGVAALRAGAGKLQLATDRTIAAQVGLAVPEAMVIALAGRGTTRVLARHVERADAILIGPGMDEAGAITTLVAQVAKHVRDDATIVLDAAALRAADRIGRGILTPHTGEMAELFGV